MGAMHDFEHEHWSSPNGCHPDCPSCAREHELAGLPDEPDEPAECVRDAAPALLAACKRVLRAIEWSATDERMTDAEKAELLRAAIRQARGEE